MNIVKKVIDLNINGEDFKAVFDMQSVIMYKQLSGKPFLASVQKLSEMDDEVILNFMASTIRKTENGKPLGKKLFDMDILSLLLNLTEQIMDLIMSSMPQATGVSEKK